jgi:hypothetical protein
VGVTKAVSGFPVLRILDDEARNFLNFRGYDMIQSGIGESRLAFSCDSSQSFLCRSLERA